MGTGMSLLQVGLLFFAPIRFAYDFPSYIRDLRIDIV